MCDSGLAILVKYDDVLCVCVYIYICFVLCVIILSLKAFLHKCVACCYMVLESCDNMFNV